MFKCVYPKDDIAVLVEKYPSEMGSTNIYCGIALVAFNFSPWHTSGHCRNITNWFNAVIPSGTDRLLACTYL